MWPPCVYSCSFLSFKIFIFVLVRTGHTDYFDAFICACENDTPFVRQLLTNLESPEHELKLCYPPRDLVIGSANYTGMAYLIQNR